MLIVKKAPFIVSLVADLRPVVRGINEALVAYGAETVRAEELAEIDRMLHDDLRGGASRPVRCPRCGGYVYADATGDYTCLNCGRPGGTTRLLENVIQQIAQGLIERRQEQSSDGVAQARRTKAASQR